MRCAMCGRFMLRATGFIAAGPVGTTCARRAGLATPGGTKRKNDLPPRTRAITPTTQLPDERQLDWVEQMEPTPCR